MSKVTQKVTFVDKKFRVDASNRSIDNNGMLTIKDSKFTRTGVFPYKARELGKAAEHIDGNKVVYLYRPPEEVFDAESLKSFNNVLVTDEHPSEMLSPYNYSQYAKGHVIQGVRQDGKYMVGDVHVTSQDLINKIMDGKSELSNGYYSDLIEESGETPEGEHYDFIQTNIQGNHLAVVSRGRAGVTCRLADAAMELEDYVREEDGEWFVYSKEGKKLSEGYKSKEEADKRLGQIEYFKNVNGEDNMPENVKTYVKDGGEEVTVVLDGMQEDIVEYIAYLNQCISNLTAEKEGVLDELRGKVEAVETAKQEVEEALQTKDGEYKSAMQDSADKETQLAELHVKLQETVEMKDSLQEIADNMDNLVSERMMLIDTGSKVIQDFSFENKSNDDIKREIVSHKVPTVDAALASTETLDALILVLNSDTSKKSTLLHNALQDSLDGEGIKPRKLGVPVWKKVRQAKYDSE